MTLRSALASVLVAAACSSTAGPPPAPATAPPHATAAAPLKPEELPETVEVAIDPRTPLLAGAVKRLLETEHLLHKPVDDAVSKEAFSDYLERLDAGKLFLLQRHVDQLARYADKMDDEMASGNLELARAGAKLLAERQKVIATVVQQLLASPFDFSVDEEFETDADKRPWAKTEAELADRWRKSLKLQVLQRVALMEDMLAAADKAQPVDSDGDGDTDKDDEIAAKRLGEIPKTPEERERKAREDLAKSFAGRFKRLAQVDPLEPAEMFLNSVTEAYDPHTQYLAPADKEDFDIAMSGSLEGIGALLVEDDHYIRVQELVPGGPSWRQGKLQAGDLILAVAQGKDGEPVDVADMRIKEVVKMIRGPKGTVVTLTVKKPDDTIQVISITRDVIEIEAAYARGAVLDRGDGSPPIGYIALPSFYGDTRRGGTVTGRNAPDDVRALLRELSARKVAAVVLDLRGNGGGLLDHARDITGMFIRTGPVVATRYGNGSTQVLTDDDPDIAYAGPVVVMVDRFSASASEILAGALQDYGRAVVVGTSATHGKGTVQVLIDLDRVAGRPRAPLGVVKLTIQQFFRVNGESTQLRGVVPDIALPDPAAYVKSGERFLDHAIPWSRIDALDYRRWTGARWQIDRLRAASEARQANEPVFAKVVERAAYLKQRLEQTRMPLQRDKWLARRAADKAKLDDVDLDWTKGPARFTVTVIDYAHTPGSSEAAAEWRDNAARDPWLDEAARIAADMAAAK